MPLKDLQAAQVYRLKTEGDGGYKSHSNQDSIRSIAASVFNTIKPARLVLRVFFSLQSSA